MSAPGKLSMLKFPSINQFRHCVREERYHAEREGLVDLKKKYRGTVKLHGTNAGVVWRPGEPLQFQSRNRILAVGDDNAGFAAYFSKAENAYWLKLAMAEIAMTNDIEPGTPLAVFGEWCGEGIQSGVAIAELPKMFVIFAAIAGDRWLENLSFSPYEDARVYSINQFPTYEMEIDFAVPGLAQNDMVAITEQVEACCPVGKHFGVEGIGEGVVWTPAENTSSKYWFKVKGEKHSSSKVAKLASVDVELVARKDDLVNIVCTENRLKQALDHHLNEAKLTLEMRDIGHFLRWVFNDIEKEESDTIEANGFVMKDLGKPISDKAKRFYMLEMQKELAVA